MSRRSKKQFHVQEKIFNYLGPSDFVPTLLIAVSQIIISFTSEPSCHGHRISVLLILTMSATQELLLEDSETGQIFKLRVNSDDATKCQTDQYFAAHLLEKAKRIKYNMSVSEKENVQPLEAEFFNISYNGDHETENSQACQRDNNDNDCIISEEPKTRMWMYNETLALINSIKDHYDDLNHPTKRKNVWLLISEDLQALNIFSTSKECHTKYRNLLRSYNAAKDNRKKTGRGIMRFQFFNEIDELLGNKAVNSSKGVIDLGLPLTDLPSPISDDYLVETEELTHLASAPMASTSATTQPKSKCTKPRNKTFRTELLEMKLDYIREKRKLIADEQQRREEENKNKQLRYKERLRLKEEKIELEKQKLILLQQLLKKQ